MWLLTRDEIYVGKLLIKVRETTLKLKHQKNVWGPIWTKLQKKRKYIGDLIALSITDKDP